MWSYNPKSKGFREIVIVLMGMMAFALCSCGNEDANQKTDNTMLAFGETRTYWEDFVLTGEIKDWDEPVVFEENGGWGFKNHKTGEVVVPPIYDNYDAFRYGIGRVRGTVNGEYGWYDVDIHGNILDFDIVSNFWAGTAIVRKDDKYGVINSESQLIVPLVYKEIFPAHGYDEETGKEKRSTYAVRDGKWVRLDLTEGYEATYEPRVEGKEYDAVYGLADYQILIVNDMLLVNGEAQTNEGDFPVCALEGVEFDCYGRDGKIGRYPCKLDAGLYEGEIMLRLVVGEGEEKPDYFAVLASDLEPLKPIKTVADTSPFMPAVNQHLAASGIENTKIEVTKCLSGDFLGDGKTGVLLEIRDAYRNPEDYHMPGTELGKMESWTEKDFQREKIAFLNMILYFPDVENPAGAFALKSNLWQYSYDDHEMTEHIHFVADVDNDGAMEIIIANQYYEYLDYAVSDIYYVQSHPMEQEFGKTHRMTE